MEEGKLTARGKDKEERRQEMCASKWGGLVMRAGQSGPECDHGQVLPVVREGGISE